jgi:HEPN domain-containing protein
MSLRAHFDRAAGLAGPQPFISFRFFIYTDDQNPFLGLFHQILVHAQIEGSTTPIGAAYLAGAHRFERSGGGSGKQVTVVLPVELATMRWLEQQRAGRGGVSFYFDWNVLGHADTKGGEPQQLQNEPVSLAIGSTPFPVNLPQEVWLEILHEVRYRDVAIIEIPLLEDGRNPLARAHEHLETARERLYRADDRGVLVACGEALDVLPNAMRIKLTKEYGYEHLVQDLLSPLVDSDRKGERLGRLLSGLRQMCLSGKHDEASLEGRPIPVDHQDALLAFLMTSATIAYLEQLPLEQGLGRRRLGPDGRSRTRRRTPRPRSSDGAGPTPPPEAEQPVEQPPAAPRRRRRRRPRAEGAASSSPTDAG